MGARETGRETSLLYSSCGKVAAGPASDWLRRGNHVGTPSSYWDVQGNRGPMKVAF